MDEFDEIDLRIMRILQKDAAITGAELAERVALSPSACHRRVQRLERRGVLRGRVARLDAERLGFRAVVFVEIALQAQSREVLDAFEAAVARIPNVLECHLMAGTADYLLKIVARDGQDFARLHRRELARLPGVAQMHSSFVLKTVCDTHALPL